MGDDVGRNRVNSCQAGAQQTARNPCVARTLENLSKLDAMGESSAAVQDALKGAARIISRLKGETTRISEAIENEKHVKSILAAKLAAMDSRHRANILVATNQERSLCAFELHSMETEIAAKQRESARIQQEIMQVKQKSESLVAEHEAIKTEVHSLQQQTEAEQAAILAVAESHAHWSDQFQQALTKRKELLEEKERAKHDLAQAEQSCGEMVALAQRRVDALQQTFTQERAARIASQTELNVVQQALKAATEEPVPAEVANLDVVL